ncbi:hypothetical protein VCHC50A2_1688A, partial [Vibrio cholerae HC-50A2]
MFDFIIQ